MNKDNEQPENILDIVADAEATGDGDRSALNARVENMNRQLVERSAGGDFIEPLSPSDAVENAVARGFSPDEIKMGAHGSVVASRQTGGNTAPRISDFFIIDTPMTPEAFMKLLNTEVLGNYDVQSHQGDADFGIMVLGHTQGLPGPGAALPGASDGPSTLARTKPMLIVKLDAGPWP
jgi:hypothetical protein